MILADTTYHFHILDFSGISIKPSVVELKEQLVNSD